MRISQSLIKGFGVTFRSFNVVLLLCIVGFGGNVVSMLLQPKVAGTAPGASSSALAIIFGIVYVLLSVFLQGGSLAYVRDRIRTGQASLGGFFKAGGEYFGRILIIGLLVGALVMASILIDAFVFGLLANSAPALGLTLVIFLGVIQIYFLLLFFFSPYAVVIDGMKPFDAIRRSFSILRKCQSAILGIIYLIGCLIVTAAYVLIPPVRKSPFGQRIFIKLVVLGTLLLIIGFGIGALFGAAIAAMGLVIKDAAMQQILFALVSSLANALIGLLMTASFMTFYLGLSSGCSCCEPAAPAQAV